MTLNLKISIHQSQSEITSIVPRWLEIFDSNSQHQYFHHPSWYLALQATLCHGDLSICLIEDQAGPLAVLPLVTSNPLFGATKLSSPSHDHISLTDWVLDDRADVEEVIQLLPEIASALDLNAWSTFRNLSVPEPSKILPAGDTGPESPTETQNNTLVHKSKTASYLRRTRQVRESFWFDCLAVNEHLRSKLKGNLRRRRKKAAQQGEIAFEAVVAQPQLENAFQDFLKIEASGWKGTQGAATAISNDPLLTEFYRHLLHSNVPGLSVHIYLLSIAEKVVAAQFVLKTNATTSMLKPAYDESYADISPGLLLMEDVLNYCATETDIKIASMVTAPPWAKPWHPKKWRVYHSTLYNNNVSGKSHALIDTVKDVIRKLRSRQA